jgi:hypothetical protein
MKHPCYVPSVFPLKFLYNTNSDPFSESLTRDILKENGIFDEVKENGFKFASALIDSFKKYGFTMEMVKEYIKHMVMMECKHQVPERKFNIKNCIPAKYENFHSPSIECINRGIKRIPFIMEDTFEDIDPSTFYNYLGFSFYFLFLNLFTSAILI